METTPSLKEELEMLEENILRDRISEMRQNTESPDELRFKELKSILKKFNKEYLFNDYMRKTFLNRQLF